MHQGQGRHEMLTFPHLVALPENRLALAAVQRLLAWFQVGRLGSPVHLLFVHGPPGTGKTHLAWALAREASSCALGLQIIILSGGDLRFSRQGLEEAASCNSQLWGEARQADLLILEDLQHLPSPAAEFLTQVLDERQNYEQPTLVTATADPWSLARLPARLTSRLAGGVVVRLEAFTPASRLAILRDRVQRRQLAVRPEVLAWLAENLTGNGRQLVAAVDRLEALSRSRAEPLDVAAVAGAFPERAESGRPTVDRIIQRVSDYFQVDPRQVPSRRRHRHALLPRQISMYLARRLTRLSLGAIGRYFGGRDHTTVLHACQKVEECLNHDAALQGAVRQLQQELT